jgi:putative FmdB family regulatory protein
MPNYEFKCKKCEKKFTLQLSFSEYIQKKTFTCPHCKGNDIVRVFSDFTAVTSKKS